MSSAPLSDVQARAEAPRRQMSNQQWQDLARFAWDRSQAAAAEDGTSLKRTEIAHGKAHGALALGMGSRAIAKRAEGQGSFIAAVSHVAGGALIPVPGGVLVRDGATLLGAVGVSGDTSDNDEVAALAGIAAVGLAADPG